MDSLELQEKTIYTHLQPFLSEYAYEAVSRKTIVAGLENFGLEASGVEIPRVETPGQEFRKHTSAGFKSLIVSFCCEEGQQVLNVHLGIRFNIIESLVSQFLKEEALPEEQLTVIATLQRFNRPPLPKLFIKDDDSLLQSCTLIKEFMQKKGFRFLNTFDKLKRIDGCLNRNPLLPSPYMPNPIHHCFKGTTLARLVQRTNFEALCTVYQNYLQNLSVPEEVRENYQKLVTFLKCYSFN